MANQIALFKEYIPLLDEVYQEASKTSQLDGNPELAQAGANANELIIPKIDMSALGDYNRNSGYVNGDVTLTNETVPVNYDRGRMFSVDTMDNAETAGIAFGTLAGEFIRTKVTPELDAFRFATYSAAEGIGKNANVLTTGEDVIKALRAASNAMDEAEVPMEDRHLFITPTLHGMISDLDTTKSKEVMGRFSSVTLVPQSRFYTAIVLRTGSGEGEENGGYQKAAAGRSINFMIIHKAAVIQFPKHIAPKIVTPEQNPDADAWKFGYRQVGVVDVYENKTAGIYLHHQ